MECVAIEPKYIDHIWPNIVDLIVKAIDYSNNELTTQSVYTSLKYGQSLLIAMTENNEIIAVCVLDIVTYPTKKICTVTLGSGTRLDEWKDMFLDTTYKLAKEAGATEVYIKGRRGWVRKLSENGFKEIATIISRGI